MKHAIGSFLSILCEVCGVERARMRISIPDGNRPVVILDHGVPLERAALPRSYASIQIPLLESPADGTAALVSRAWTAQEPVAEPPLEDGAFVRDGEHPRWDFRRDAEGFHVELSLFLREGSAGFVNERLTLVDSFLDLFESLLPGRPLLDRHLGPELGAVKFDPPLLGETPSMAELKRKIALLAPSDIPVLIEGESGTGKEVVAQNIHRLSRRRGKPLVIASSSEVPHSLFQSELFGHAEGSVTGASRDRAGLIESANGGTFFLDEIGEMPLTLQATLLRVLQEKEVRRLGESKRRPVDVRFVFATNRDLRELARKGRFRKDLYFRIGCVRLAIPPLRGRKEDVVALASHFLRRAAGQVGCRAPVLSPGAVRRLVRYHWPGNVRELKAEMERLVAINAGERVIVPELLSPHLDESSDANPALAASEYGSIPEAVQRLERAMIREALGRFAGNRTKAAEALGITRQGLLKKLKRYSAPEKDPSVR